MAENPVRAGFQVDQNPEQIDQSPGSKRVADLLVQALYDAGIELFLGVPGGAIGPIYDALYELKKKHPEIRVINTRHETMAAFIAMGYARSHPQQKIACVLVTSGPGITNIITGLAAAHADGIPFLVLAGEVPSNKFGRGALQEGSPYSLDVLSMVRSVCKTASEMRNSRAAVSVLRKAISTARSGRKGPVFLSLPIDVAVSKVIPTHVPGRVRTAFEVTPEILEESAQALLSAGRGLIMVGSGARDGDGPSLIQSLAERLQIPVCTTPKAKGVFPESHPLSLGVFGYAGHPSVMRRFEEDGGVDVLFTIGCGLGETSTNNWSNKLQPQKTFIQLDIDVSQIGKNYHVHCGLVGPCQIILKELHKTLDTMGVPLLQNPHSSQGTSSKKVETIDDKHLQVNEFPLKPQYIMAEMQKMLPSDAIFTADIGEHMLYAIHYLTINRPDSFMVNFGFGSMGSGIGAAIGLKLAHPDRQVVSFCGDFGFQMFGNELATCVQENIGVIFAVLNDSQMRMVENGFSKTFFRSIGAKGYTISFKDIGIAMGANAYAINENASFHKNIEKVMANTNKSPTLLEFIIDENEYFAQNSRVTEFGKTA